MTKPRDHHHETITTRPSPRDHNQREQLEADLNKEAEKLCLTAKQYSGPRF
ncbi:MAG: hypothetical protein HRU09_20665 [Oligoflexales bacterium]|nr:hypothetical protein [Oligoflexales bacterium]